ncbi:DEAD/DEAH box helicase [Vibrio diabolicus]|uniref:DEAD/DEAH box helicase n=1 Tax=Vibrio diabolicus TaxID=50719 RepID=UPI0022868AB9|nr:DEAD/DEAH box helicase [Vibrio diabolicus]MCZ0741818.1 DEAD/DEAH box helicase [Vibrio diabolicus]
MRDTLKKWINDADKLRQLKFFAIPQTPIDLAHVANRPQDLYISLVGELFTRIKEPSTSSSEWAQLGNAFLQFAMEMSVEQLESCGVSKDESILFAASSFYFGNYPASAYLAMRHYTRAVDDSSLIAGFYDLLVRPAEIRSEIARKARMSLSDGNVGILEQLVQQIDQVAHDALTKGPADWVVATLLQKVLKSFSYSNIRSVLPNGNHAFWSPLVNSLIFRQPPTWEFFPSQVEAIQRGLLTSTSTYSLQMPTGAGKTTLCETLLYTHLKSSVDDVAIMVVPYRSLASELRGTLVRRLNSLGIASRCAYGGTIPVGDELHELDNVRAVIATPESLSGLLEASPNFSSRIGLIIIDEGHLLDGEGRGIGLELLLARMKGHVVKPIRFVFISAIVPNVEEINAWLGGHDQTVVRSLYRPAIAEFSVLKSNGSGVGRTIDLKMHPHEDSERQFSVNEFLDRKTFSYVNPETGRLKTYKFDSIKVQTIAAARKSLSMGATAIFAANKRGKQGAIGIAESLVEQLSIDLPIPSPMDFSRKNVLQKAIDYFDKEYGSNWIGTRSIQNGFALHHGDIPQESREVLEKLIRNQDVKLVICTSTLAEGVNLPIRTLVLYSVQRRHSNQLQNMLTRDIKNLVGRAGRAGANTKGLVICANPDQWGLVKPVAMQSPGEPVRGSLMALVDLMTKFLTQNNVVLNNQFLEQNSIVHPLIDGVDSTLMELLADEMGEEEFITQATQLAEQTFAAAQLTDAAAHNLRLVFSLRAMRIKEFQKAGKITWAREAGAKIRLIESVEQNLLPLKADWSVASSSLSDEVRVPIFQWAWTLIELREKVKECFRLGENENVENYKERFFEIVRLWMSGYRFSDIAAQTSITVDELLTVHSSGITFSLQTVVEQGISLLAKRLESDGVLISEGVKNFPEHLRFGVPTNYGRALAEKGVRHRTAYVQLGTALEHNSWQGTEHEVSMAALNSITGYSDQWRAVLGELVYQNTLSDLS